MLLSEQNQANKRNTVLSEFKQEYWPYSRNVVVRRLGQGYTREQIIQQAEDSVKQKMQGMETDLSKTRLYDIRNAGPHHRFTVSNKLVHNCGYGWLSRSDESHGRFGLWNEGRRYLSHWLIPGVKLIRKSSSTGGQLMQPSRKHSERSSRSFSRTWFSHTHQAFSSSSFRQEDLWLTPSQESETNKYGTESVTYMGLGLNKKCGTAGKLRSEICRKHHAGDLTRSSHERHEQLPEIQNRRPCPR